MISIINLNKILEFDILIYNYIQIREAKLSFVFYKL